MYHIQSSFRVRVFNIPNDMPSLGQASFLSYADIIITYKGRTTTQQKTESSRAASLSNLDNTVNNN